MEKKGWLYYSLQEKHLYYNDSGSFIQFKSTEKIPCYGYDHVVHVLETWEYVNVNGWKKLLQAVFIPDTNIYMPYLEQLKSNPDIRFVTIYQFNKTLYQTLDYVRHAQNCRSNSYGLNMGDYRDLYADVFEQIIKRELDEEGYPTNTIFLGSDQIPHTLIDQREFATDAQNRML